MVGRKLFAAHASCLDDGYESADGHAGSGFYERELLAAICFLKQGKRSLIVWAALMGAAAAGTRPQLFPVVAVIFGIPLKQASVNAKTWSFTYALLVAGCLLWLLPMWYMQSQLRRMSRSGVCIPSLPTANGTGA